MSSFSQRMEDQTKDGAMLQYSTAKFHQYGQNEIQYVRKLGNINRSENLSESERDMDEQSLQNVEVQDFSKYIWVQQKQAC